MMQWFVGSLLALSVILCVGAIGAVASPEQTGLGYALAIIGAGGLIASAILWVGDDITTALSHQEPNADNDNR
jgi:hypothetical protein